MNKECGLASVDKEFVNIFGHKELKLGGKLRMKQNNQLHRTQSYRRSKNFGANAM
jgi:hypothetical protein